MALRLGTGAMASGEQLPGKQRFVEAYRNAHPPWDIGKAQNAFMQAADQVAGTVLDVGCGTGENALFFAERGHPVTGIDFLEAPILQAHRKAQQRGVQVEFLVYDALKLSRLGRTYDSLIDCGLFHVFSDDDRARYVGELALVIKPQGTLLLMCFSDKEPGTYGPRRVSQQEIREAFRSRWKVVSITESRFEVRPDFKEFQFSAGGPFAWFCVLRRNAEN